MPVNETKLYAFEIVSRFNEDPIKNIPLDFFRHIESTAFRDRWLPQIADPVKPSKDQPYKNIRNFQQISTEEGSPHIIFYGELVEVSAEDLKLTNFIDGEQTTKELDTGKGLEKSWHFALSHKYNTLVISNNAVNSKLSNYLNGQIFYSKINTIDDIQIQSKLVESDPQGFLRKNPNIGSIKFRLDAAAFTKKYGLFSSSFIGAGTATDGDNLVVELSITNSGKGKELPVVLTEHFADFLQTAEQNDILGVSVKEVIDGKKLSSKRIMDAFQTKQIRYQDESEIKSHVIDFLLQLIELEKEDA